MNRKKVEHDNEKMEIEIISSIKFLIFHRYRTTSLDLFSMKKYELRTFYAMSIRGEKCK
jgi:hypothetical protein